MLELGAGGPRKECTGFLFVARMECTKQRCDGVARMPARVHQFILELEAPGTKLFSGNFRLVLLRSTEFPILPFDVAQLPLQLVDVRLHGILLHPGGEKKGGGGGRKE